jgi:micrococcal nuclease
MDYKYNARNIRVIDGDTIEAEIDLGFRVFRKDIFRLAGIQAPEHDKASTDFLRSSLEEKTVILESRRSEKYGRWLAIVYADGVNVNQAMIDIGLAIAYNGGKR